jgi:hypothetical protein
MWSDLDIVVESKQEGGYRFQYADRRSHAIEHPSEQYNNVYPPNNFQHLKLVPPWMFLCNENIQFAFLEHTWNLLHFNSFRVLPGVINFKYQTAGNVNIMIPKTDSEQFIHIPFKEPLAQIIPLSDRPIKLVLHADKDKFDALDDKFNRQFRFVKQYLTSSKIRRNNERNE